jgi:hypothetical protein
VKEKIYLISNALSALKLLVNSPQGDSAKNAPRPILLQAFSLANQARLLIGFKAIWSDLTQLYDPALLLIPIQR